MSVPDPSGDGRRVPLAAVPDPDVLPSPVADALGGLGVRWDPISEDAVTRRRAVVELRVPLGAERRVDAVLRALGFVRLDRTTAETSYVGFDAAPDVGVGRWITLVVARRDRIVAITRPGVATAPRSRTIESIGTRVRARLPGGRGLTVALLGPDGTGKSTIALAVADAFPFASRVVYMGLWQRRAVRVRPLIPGTDLARRLAFAWRRYLVGRYHRARGSLVVYDRYVYDALAGVPDARSLTERAYLWLLGRSCPSPDLVLVLDVPGVVAFGRKGEHGALQLERDRRRLLDMAARRRHWQVVDADRPRAAVEADVTARIWRRYRARWRA